MPADEGLKPQLRQMIVDRLFLDVDPAGIADDADLMQDYNLDSVNLFEIVVGLEEEFGLSLEDTDFCLETFASVRSIADFVASKRD
jgi:acyl carrier protein